MSGSDAGSDADVEVDVDRRTTSGATCRLAAAVDRGRTAVYDTLWPLFSRTTALKNLLRSTEGRTAALVVVAYVTGTVGLGLSLFGEPTDPNAKYGAVGITLMGSTFACLFLLSVSVLDATGAGGRPSDRDRHAPGPDYRGDGRGSDRSRDGDR